MKISIVVPSFNQARYLDVSLRSIVEQEHGSKEIIVLDGGSTDGSLQIIRKYERDLAYWRSSADGGQTAAIAEGFRIATGDIIGWVASDDALSKGALQRVAEAAQRAGKVDCVFYGGYEVIDESNAVQEVYTPIPMIPWIARAIGPTLCQPGTFFGRNAFLRAGGLDTSVQYCMDFELWMRFFQSGVTFQRIPDIQGQYRRHSLQKGHSLQWIRQAREEAESIAGRYGMAKPGSLRYLVALQTQRLVLLITASTPRTICFRLYKRRRLKSFEVDYSA